MFGRILDFTLLYSTLFTVREYKAESRRKVFPRPAVKKVQGEFDTEGEFPKAGCLDKGWSGSTN